MDHMVIVVIVFAYAISGFGEIPTLKGLKAYHEKIENNLVFVGRVSMIDPPREEAKHDSEKFKFKTA
ncbi:hypothetical protein MUP01_13510 [Candidatus Bathyarchaeota archaeon]|nr:hypothetical protein [Candidatus Bathyarchaeota archaeon]